MNQEFKKLFKEKTSSIFDDVEYFVDLRGGSDGECIVYYNNMIFDIQHYMYDNVLRISSTLTGIIHKGKTIQPSPIDWGYDESSTNYSIEQLVDNLICEITSCNAKAVLRNVITVINSIKEDFTADEFELFKTLLDYYE